MGLPDANGAPQTLAMALGGTALDDLIDLLASMAEAEEEPERRSKLKRAGITIAGLGRVTWE